MGKDLKGKELGVGLSQRPDGRYYARTSYKGHQIAFYGFNYQEMKKRLKEEKQKIDAGKGVKALCMRFSGAGACNDVPVKNDVCAARTGICGVYKRFKQIAPRVAVRHLDGFLRTR